MPYFTRQEGDKWCVVSGTKENPGETKHCYSGDTAHAQAVDYLRALYVHVEDAGKRKDDEQPEVSQEGITAEKLDVFGTNVGVILESSVHRAFTVAADTMYGLGRMSREERIKLSSSIGDSLDILVKTLDEMGLKKRFLDPEDARSIVYGHTALNAYKEVTPKGDIDRWIAVSTIEKVDIEGEVFTKEAMDWDSARALRTGKYPELRLFHVRAFKLGQCDDMSRVNEHAVDMGYWYKTPFAQAVKEVIIKDEERKKNGTSRGFYSVKATGHCPDCGGDLMVGLANYIFGVSCTKCAVHHEPKKLKTMGLRHLQTVTFDISITDVPAVPGTAVAAYTLTSSEQGVAKHGN